VGKSRLKSIIRFIVRTLANIILPISFRFNFWSSKWKLNESLPAGGTNGRIVVSLTSFPARIGKLWMVIFSMLKQTKRPDLIILYLSKDQFPGGLKSLPRILQRFNKLGLLNVFFKEDDLRSHKKYYYSFKAFKDDLIVTVDDDIFYPENTIQDLFELYMRFPNSICCQRAYKVSRTVEGGIGPYNDWRLLREGAGPSFDVFHTSGGGTLYRPKFFNDDIFDVNVFKELCFSADDIWLNFHANRSGITTVKSNRYSEIIPVMQWNNVRLKEFNVYDGGNDKQLKALVKHYNVDERNFFK
jgi:hypothetical protein